MTSEKKLGIVCPVPRGDWNKTTTYYYLNIVKYSTASFIAKKSNINIEPLVSSHWKDYWQLLVGAERFTISKTYSSISEMNANFSTDDVPLYGFVLIETGNANNEDNAKLFVKEETGYEYLTDLSGSQGIQGEQGVGITAVSLTEEKGLDFTLSNGEHLYTASVQGPQGEQGPRGEKGEDAQVEILRLL